MIALIGSLDPLTTVVATRLEAAGTPCLICVINGRTTFDPKPGQSVTFRIEHFGTLLRHLAARDVREVCFSGKIVRPRVDPMLIDGATAPLVPRLLEALQQGDDGALRVVTGLFEEAGFKVVAAQDIVPELLPPRGILTVARPSPLHLDEAARAERVHRVVAPADIGQGVVVRDGQVLAVEAALGTDFMLRSVEGLADGAVFFKAPKLGQDRRVDLPVVGPATVERARAARLAAIVIEAGGVMMLDREDTIAAADAAGLVIWVREPGP